MRGKATVMPCIGMVRMPGQVRVKAVRVKCRSTSREADLAFSLISSVHLVLEYGLADTSKALLFLRAFR
jgi:hypothetical protein